jgi:hypothetical protein
MKIFAASATEAADTFLHAGYISAQPSAQILEYPTLADTADTGTAMSLEEAFRLAAPATNEAAVGLVPGLVETLGLAAPHLLGLAALVAAVALLARYARQVPAKASAMGAVLVLAACVEAPWEDIEPEETENPETYTSALLHTVVKEGLMDHHFTDGDVGSLADLADSVALPVDDLSESMAYVLETYGLDGWGNEMTLEAPDEDHYEVVSAGPDGQPDTGDDISATFDVSDAYDVDRTFYLSRVAGVLWLTIRSGGESSNSWGEELDGASHQSGDSGEYCFDEKFYRVPLTETFLVENYEMYWGDDEERDWAAVVAELETFYAGFATETDPDPIVMQVFDQA